MTKDKLNNILDKISLFVLGIVIILAGIYVGSPLKDPIYILFAISNIWTAIYLIIKKCLRAKNLIIKNKIDIAVIIFVLANFIPLIFKTYTTLEGTVSNILLYITLFSIYELVRNVIKDKKQILFLGSCIIISTIFPIIFGIDMVTTNVFEEFLSKINSVNIEQSRLASTFGYPNSFAIYTSIGIITSIYLFLNIKNKYVKPIIASYLFLAFLTILLTFSRATIFLIAILFIIFLIMLKDRKKVANTIILIISSLITAGAFYILFNYLVDLEKYQAIWYFLGIATIFTFILNLYLNELSKYAEKIKIKTIIYIVIIGVVFILAYIIIGFQIPDSLELFNNISSEADKSKDIYGLNVSTNYNFEFNIKTDTHMKNNDNIYKIQIVERNKYYSETIIGEETFGDFEGTKTLNVTTSDDMTKLFIKFYKLTSNDYSSLTINELKINGETINLNYKILPEKLVYTIQNLNFTNKSMEERISFLKDCTKLIKDNWLLGIGGDGWYYRYEEVQEYSYAAREPHCYPLQIFLENGIIGIISYVAILIITIINYIKNKDKNETINGVFLIFLLMVLHSMMDFDLSFLCIIIQLFICIGILNNNIGERLGSDYGFKEKIIVIGKHIIDYICIISFLLVSITSIVFIYAENSEENINTKLKTTEDYKIASEQYENIVKLNPIKKNYKIKLINNLNGYIKLNPNDVEMNNKYKNYIQTLRKDEPYYSRMTLQTMLMTNYIQTINDDNKQEYIKEIENIYNDIKNDKEPLEFNVNNIVNRVQSISKLYDEANKKYKETGFNELKEISDKLYNLLIEEKDMCMNNLLDYKKNQQDEFLVRIYAMRLEKLYVSGDGVLDDPQKQ